MTVVFKIISYGALALTIVPAFLVFAGRMSWDLHANLMLAGTVLWFVFAPLWFKDKK